MNEIEKAKAILRDAGYFVDNLWSVNDVKDRFKCGDSTAIEIIGDALTNEWIMEQINVSITQACEHIGLEEI